MMQHKASTRNRPTMTHESIHSYHSAKVDHTDKRSNVLCVPLTIGKAPSQKGVNPLLDAKTLKISPVHINTVCNMINFKSYTLYAVKQHYMEGPCIL